jgi:hypothetical protein
MESFPITQGETKQLYTKACTLIGQILSRGRWWFRLAGLAVLVLAVIGAAACLSLITGSGKKKKKF